MRIRKVLIANRGEIAVRITKSCRKLGLGVAAVYSDSDRDALHVKYADEAHHIGPSNPSKSYLNIERLAEAIVKSNADAVHPGYGFLSENPAFARRVEGLGVTWIGPPPDLMEKLTSKTYSRKVATEESIPVIPGSHAPVNQEEARKDAEKFGFPLLLKADAGGGGRGVRRVETQSELQGFFESASREALYAFGKPDLYVEKLLEGARHIEVQVLVDGHDNLSILGERECSIQRRYQKLMEETPSPALRKDSRDKIFDLAKRFARAIGYVNAGTVEFLMDKNGNLHFLEMNKRIQVEHPVTEMVTGVDIVEQQLRIASGEETSLSSELQPAGHAMECRVYAEDPTTFVPSPGSITRMVLPNQEGVRIDHALEVGATVSPFYDPLIAKIIARGSDRGDCLTRLTGSLSETVIEGTKTNIPFILRLIGTKEFAEANFDTAYVDNMLSRMADRKPI